MATRKKDGTQKTKVVALRVTPEEHSMLKKKADEADVTMSDFLFAAAFDKGLIVLDMAIMKELLYELQKVGVNLNQLLILCHKGKVTHPNINEVIALQNKILEEVLRLIGQVQLRKKR